MFAESSLPGLGGVDFVVVCGVYHLFLHVPSQTHWITNIYCIWGVIWV